MNTIKGHLVKKIAGQIMIEIRKWNNNQSLSESEIKELVNLLEKELLNNNEN